MSIGLLYLFLQLDPRVQESLMKAMTGLDRFKVSFMQRTYSDFFDDTVAEGELWVVRPGKMRMTYTKGEQKTLIWDGTTCYERDEMAGTEDRLRQTEVADEPLVRILLYGSALTEHFLVDRIVEEGRDLFRLRPRDGQKYVVLMSFSGAWLPEFVDVRNEDGEGSSLWFRDFDLNPNMPQSLFEIPAAPLSQSPR